MSLEKITADQIAELSIERLANRPNAVSRYGVSGLTPEEYKKRFDALAKLAISKYNELIDAIGALPSQGNAIAKLILTPIEVGVGEGEYLSLFDVLAYMQSGDFAGYFALNGLAKDNLQDELEDIEDDIDSLESEVEEVKNAVGNPSDGADASGSAFARIAKIAIDLAAAVTAVNLLNENKINKSDIVDNLTLGGSAKVLSAEQGKALNIRLSSAEAGVYSLNGKVGSPTDAASAVGSLFGRSKYNYDLATESKNAIGDEETFATMLYRIKELETELAAALIKLDGITATTEARQVIITESTEYLSEWLKGTPGYTITYYGEPITPAELISPAVFVLRAEGEPDFWWDSGINTPQTVEVNGVEYVSTATVGGVVIGGLRKLEYDFSEVDAAVSEAEGHKDAAQTAREYAEAAETAAKKWATGEGALTTDPQYENNAKFYAELIAGSADAAVDAAYDALQYKNFIEQFDDAFRQFEVYNPGKQYTPGYKVSYNGSSYFCIKNSLGNAPTNTEYWILMAAKGEKGADGADGKSLEFIWSGTLLGVRVQGQTYQYTDLKGAPGDSGAKGDPGEKGDMPDHEVAGMKIRFEKPDGTWGDWLDLSSTEVTSATIIAALGFTPADADDIPTKTSDLTNDSGFLTSLPAHTHDDRYYTESEIDSKLAAKANVSGVYSKSETDTLLSAKANASDVYSKSAADGLLENKADKADVYTKSATDTLLAAKADASTVYSKTEANALLAAKADATSVYTKAETDSRIEAIIGSAPEALDTLQEIAEALDNNADFAGTMVTELGKKANKVTSATSGNFAGLDASGNLTDSGKKAADFATAEQGTLAENAVPNTRKVNNKALSADISLSASDVGAVPATRKINNKELSSDVSLGAVDVGAVPTSRTVNSKPLSADISLAASDVGAVPTSRTVNGKALTSNITLAASDVGAVPTSRKVNNKALSSDISLSASDVGAVAVNQGSGNSGKFLVVGADGNVTLQTLAVWAGGSY